MPLAPMAEEVELPVDEVEPVAVPEDEDVEEVEGVVLPVVVVVPRRVVAEVKAVERFVEPAFAFELTVAEDEEDDAVEDELLPDEVRP